MSKASCVLDSTFSTFMTALDCMQTSHGDKKSFAGLYQSLKDLYIRGCPCGKLHRADISELIQILRSGYTDVWQELPYHDELDNMILGSARKLASELLNTPPKCMLVRVLSDAEDALGAWYEELTKDRTLAGMFQNYLREPDSSARDRMAREFARLRPAHQFDLELRSASSVWTHPEDCCGCGVAEHDQILRTSIGLWRRIWRTDVPFFKDNFPWPLLEKLLHEAQLAV